MLVADLLHSCANDSVAEAAVCSIGGEFTARMQEEAVRQGVSVGRLAAGIVRDFARLATERDWRELTEATRGHDFPVLAGLQVILSRPSYRPRVDDRRVDARSIPSVPTVAIIAANYANAGGY
jgi:hypothetical protein